jgi:hypothetical protein
MCLRKLRAACAAIFRVKYHREKQTVRWFDVRMIQRNSEAPTTGPDSAMRFSISNFIAANLLSLVTTARADRAVDAAFAINRAEYLLAMNWDGSWSVDSDASLVAADVHDRDLDVCADADDLVAFTRKNEHAENPFERES